MKKKIITGILALLFCNFLIASYGQIYSNGFLDGSITISPKGISGSKQSNLSSYTNIALGDSVLSSNTTGYSNVGVGSKSLVENTSGISNTAVGAFALQKNITGIYNVAVGTGALTSNIDGDRNAAIGSSALSKNESGNDNIALGASALYNNISGLSNISMGYHTFYNNTTGSFNQAIGKMALLNNISGNNNTAIGDSALLNTDASYNIAIGTYAGFSNVTGAKNVFLGYKAGYNSLASNKLYIENSDSTSSLISGDFALNRVGINRLMSALETRTEAFQVNGEAFKNTGTGNWVIPSDRRLKENIVYLSSQEMLIKVLQMKGVSYHWIDKSRGKDKVLGFIAQDLQQIFPENVKTDKEGYLSASYGAYDPMIIEAIKALNEKIENLQNENIQLKAHNEKLLKRLDNIEARLNN